MAEEQKSFVIVLIGHWKELMIGISVTVGAVVSVKQLNNNPLPDLPPKIVQNVPAENTPAQLKPVIINLTSSAPAPLVSAKTNESLETAIVAEPVVVILQTKPAQVEPTVREQKISAPIFPESRRFEFLEARATGVGGSRAAAVTAALSEAVSMRLGAIVSGELAMALNSERTSINDVESDKIRETLGSRFESASKGVVKWWDWEKEHYDGSNYTLTVVAVLAKPKPKTMDPNARKVVVALPFAVDRDATLLTKKIDKVKLGKALAASVANYLVQGRKFVMIESGEGALGAKAASIGNEPLAGLIESADALEADYLVVGDAANIVVSRFKPGVGVLPEPAASGTVNFRVVRIDNRQTVLSRKFDLSSVKPDSLTGRDLEATISDAIGSYVSQQMHETVFPIKVLAINGDSEVVLNRGGDGIKVGDVYELFTLGPVVNDPDTGEGMQVEQKSGEVTILRVTPKMSYASVISRSGQIVNDSLCRKK
jgi:hypothetical protein